jgi:lysozyme family protein
MVDTVALKARETARWANAKILRPQVFAAVAQRLVNGPVELGGQMLTAKQVYQQTSALTKVPWWFIAVAHERECSQDWHGSLAQGDPWNKVSIHVPAGRGPFKSWIEAAIDALVNCAPHAARNVDWTIGSALEKLEEYNGLGYAARGIASPYIWSGTDQYHGGKYVRDGVFDPNAYDQQLGCAGLLKAMMAIDPTIVFAQ